MPAPAERRSWDRRADGERIATIEEKLTRAIKDIGHIDTCVDSIKRAIWLATGIIVSSEFFLRWFFKG
jgi:hypothetical protein